jgi:Flp pilus assembly pilin Flp
MVTKLLRRLFRDVCGQDVIEFTLLVAFVALTSSALFIGRGQSTRRVWEKTDERLEEASRTSGADTDRNGKTPTSVTEHPIKGGE